MRFNLLVAFIFTLSLSGFSQQNYRQNQDTVQPWWEYGIQFGAYVADNYTADFYNGEGVNDITQVTENDVFQDRILQAIPYEEFEIGAMPQNMAYKTATMPGLHLEYHKNRMTSFFVNFQYVKLVTRDGFKVIDPNEELTFEDYILSTIRAEEERVYIDVGVKQAWPLTDHFTHYMIGGLNVSNTTVMSHKIDIGSFTRSIKSRYSDEPFNPNYPHNEYDFKQGGIGFGIVGGWGVKLTYQQSLYAAIDLTAYYNQTILPDNQQFGVNFAPMLRLGYKAQTLLPAQ